MIKKSFLLSLLLLSLTFAAPTYTEEDNVVVLTDDNYEEFLSTHKYVLVEFYAPWCGHCQQLAPEYATSAKELKSNDPIVYLAKVDATKHEKITGQYPVEGYPTLFFFEDGHMREFTGDRDQEGITRWCQKQTGPASFEIQSIQQFDKLKSDNEVLVVYFGDKKNEENLMNFEFVAKSDESASHLYAYVYDNDIKAHAKVELNKEKIVLFKNFDEGRNEYDGEFDAEKIYSQFIEKYAFPTILPFDESTAQRIFDEGKTTLFLFTDNSEKSEKYSKVLDEAKDGLKDQVMLCRTGIEHDYGQRLGEYLGIYSDAIPTLVLSHFTGDDLNKYYFDKEVNAENLIKFVSDYKEGKLVKTLLSEPVPEESEQKPVRKVVADTYYEHIHNLDQNVFLKIYAPWCGACQALEPEYIKLAEHYAQKSENIIIAEMDATKNEIEGLYIAGYPTMKFYPAGRQPEDEPLDYEGERELDDLLKFVEDNKVVTGNEQEQQDKQEQKQQEQEEQKERKDDL